MKRMRIGIIGAGLTGATIARLAANDGHFVDVYEKRHHIGGNCYDIDEFDSFTHKYGPHLFHTSDQRVVEFLSQFSEFKPYFHKVNAWVDGGFIPLPFSLASLLITHPQFLANRLIEKLVDRYGFGSQASIHSLLSDQEPELRELGGYIYKSIFYGYSVKQWGVSDPMDLDKGVLDRIPIRINFNTDYFTDKYQMLPVLGYTVMLKNILSHPNITCSLDHPVNGLSLARSAVDDNLQIEGEKYDHVFYCGMPDHLIEGNIRSLPYRSLEFKQSIVQLVDGIMLSPSLQMNYPCNFAFTRVSDYSFIGKALGRNPVKSKLIEEYPGTYQQNAQQFGDPYYPVFIKDARDLYSTYRSKLRLIQAHITVCGRLGDYKYYDMDDAIIAAFGKYQRFTDGSYDN